MRATATMRREVSENDEVKLGQDGGPELSEDGDESLIAAKPLRFAVGKYEAAKQAAIDLEVDPAYLTRMCAGTKPTTLLHVWRLVQRNRQAARELVSVLANQTRMVVVPMLDLKLEPREVDLLLRTRQSLGSFWPAHRDDVVAPTLKCSGDMVDVALDYHQRLSK